MQLPFIAAPLVPEARTLDSDNKFGQAGAVDEYRAAPPSYKRQSSQFTEVLNDCIPARKNVNDFSLIRTYIQVQLMVCYFASLSAGL